MHLSSDTTVNPMLATDQNLVEQKPVVYIVDDNRELCQVLKRLIETNGLMCQAYTCAEEFLKAYDADRPGCIILDVRMPGMSGLELQEFLRAKGSLAPVLILTGHADVPVALRAMKAGAFEFLEKPVSNQILLENVRRALTKESEERQARIEVAEVRRRYKSLTKREREVMQLVVQGRSNREVGEALGLRQKTVEVHRSNLMRKMGTKALASLVRMAVSLEDEGQAMEVSL